MSPIPNWTKITDEAYAYTPADELRVQLENHADATIDGRHSLWYGDLIDTSTDTVLKEVVEGATTKRQARKSMISWMRDHPELDVASLREEGTDE